MFALLAQFDYWGMFLVPVSIGFVAGLAMGRLRFKWALALTTMLVPPALWQVLYWLSSQSGCSGGDCAGPMIFLMILMVPFGCISLGGIGLTAATSVEMFLPKRGRT